MKLFEAHTLSDMNLFVYITVQVCAQTLRTFRTTGCTGSNYLFSIYYTKPESVKLDNYELRKQNISGLCPATDPLSTP